MKCTKEDLENLKNDPMANELAEMFGLDLNKLIEAEMKNVENEIHKTQNILDKMVSDGVLKCEETRDGNTTIKRYYSVEEKKEEPKEQLIEKQKYEKPKAKEQPFLMSASQLEKFIIAYSELIEAEKKLSYLYGVEFTDGESGFGFPSKVNEIIWNFVRIIFGDENAEDIADYIFGNSNFDNVKSLYEELV